MRANLTIVQPPKIKPMVNPTPQPIMAPILYACQLKSWSLDSRCRTSLNCTIEMKSVRHARGPVSKGIRTLIPYRWTSRLASRGCSGHCLGRWRASLGQQARDALTTLARSGATVPRPAATRSLPPWNPEYRRSRWRNKLK